MAKALYDKIPLNLCLNRSIYKYLLDQCSDPDIEDLKFYDTVHYNSMKYILENDINDDPLIE